MNIGTTARSTGSPTAGFVVTRSRWHARLTEHYRQQVVPAAATAQEVACWRTRYPALAELTDLTVLPQLVAADADAVLTALLAAHQDGSQLAGAVLLNQMMPKLLRLTRYARVPGYCRHSAYADRGAATIAAFLTVIAEFRPRPGQRVAGQLSLNTLHAITIEAQVEPEVPVPDVATIGPAAGGRRRRGLQASSRQGLVVADVVDWEPDPWAMPAEEVLDWAVRHGAITVEDRDLLAAAYLGTDTDLRAVAVQFGLSYPALRQRLHRRLGAVRAAVCAHLEIEADVEPGRRTHICHTVRPATPRAGALR